MAGEQPLAKRQPTLKVELKDVPSGIEGVTLSSVATPEEAMASIPCKKFTWVLDQIPMIELDFGEDTKKFQFHVASSNFDLFNCASDVKFERTATHSIFTIRKTDRNPPSRINVLEEYTKKFWSLLKCENYEVRFNMFHKYDFENCFIWKYTRKFSVIYFSTLHDVTFTQTQLRFLLEEVAAEQFRLPKIKFTEPLPSTIGTVWFPRPIKHQVMDIYSGFFPFEYFINMESKHVKARADSISAMELNWFVRAWVSGNRLENLETFTFYFTEATRELTYHEVLKDIEDAVITRVSKQSAELNVGALMTLVEHDYMGIGQDVMRRSDGHTANVLLLPTRFVFTVKDKDEQA